MRIVSPSVLSADFGNLARDIDMLNGSSAEWIHIDVMDGVFVPNISFGFPVLKAIRRHSEKVLDVHIMIVEPERYVERFAQAGADIITFHLEATEDPLGTIVLIRESGARAGISIKPATPVEALGGLIDQLDLILIMSVEPGFGGQSFIPESLERVAQLREMIERMIPNEEERPYIEVDGGISAANSEAVFGAGADVLVMGSAIFGAADPLAEIEKVLG